MNRSICIEKLNHTIPRKTRMFKMVPETMKQRRYTSRRIRLIVVSSVSVVIVLTMMMSSMQQSQPSEVLLLVSAFTAASFQQQTHWNHDIAQRLDTSSSKAFTTTSTNPIHTTTTTTTTTSPEQQQQQQLLRQTNRSLQLQLVPPQQQEQCTWSQTLTTIMIGCTILLSSIFVPNAALAENELSAKYGNSGFDTSLVDQTCLLDHCSLQAKACLQDDPSCRKGLTCTAKCLGDNACITGCMARYGNTQLDSLLKCTIEDHECIKIAILPGGSDAYGTEPPSPIPTVLQFDYHTMEGSWYKVIGYNPNYDCYACQRNTFTPPTSTSSSSSSNSLQMDVDFSMPHLLPDGSPLPPSGIRETVDFLYDDDDDDFNDATKQQQMVGLQSIALNDYHTHETMIFDTPTSTTTGNYNPMQQLQQQFLTLNQGTTQELSYARTAHSEGEMFGLKFWENWYIIGENEKDSAEEFKFVYYNGKTRQNTYEGAFIYSRTKELSPDSMKQIYQIAKKAGMDPNQFCRIRNGCFTDEAIPVNSNSLQRRDNTGLGSPNNPFRGILASTRVSELLGVEPVAARDMLRRNIPTASVLTPDLPLLSSSSDESTSLSSSASTATTPSRHWWYEVGDYLENPHRHFKAMDQLRQPMIWPKDVVEASR